MIASCLLRPDPKFGRHVVEEGLRRCGYTIREAVLNDPSPHDVLVIWNEISFGAAMAERYRQLGANVIVIENGYLGREWRGGLWYAVARDHHNGAGAWPEGGQDRWNGWGIPLTPWRDAGEEIIVFAQRGIGAKSLRSPPSWERAVRAELQKRTSRPIRIREHPGRLPESIGLADDLRNAWACVTWGSGAALKALLSGVPVFHACPSWIGKSAALPIACDLESPFLGDRTLMFSRLAWAMWEAEEIASGEPFRLLLQ